MPVEKRKTLWLNGWPLLVLHPWVLIAAATASAAYFVDKRRSPPPIPATVTIRSTNCSCTCEVVK